MEKYLVGGAVRDAIMGKVAADNDYVVIGSTPQEMIDQGFSEVGKDFPVFLHPETGDEYALARIERKVGSGHTGFECDFNPEITLEQDLERRDLTINSLAADIEDKTVYDFFGGLDDINNGILRHVSDAFAEDPLRVLRVARFAAKFPTFEIAPETMELCKEIGQSQEFKELSPERVTGELDKVMRTSSPSSFFYVLKEMECLDVFFPEIANLIGKTQPEKWHPEGDAFVHTMEVFDIACGFCKDTLDDGTIKIAYAALFHDLGKGTTPEDILPHHYGHEKRGVGLVDKICDRLKLSNDIRKLSKIVAEFHTHVHNVDKLNPKTLAKLYDRIGGNFIREHTFSFTIVSWFDAMGRGPEFRYENAKNYRNHLKMNYILMALRKVKYEGDPKANPQTIKNIIYKDRINMVKKAIEEYEQLCA